MIVLLQRVIRAAVEVDGVCVGAIDRGLLIFLGIEEDDGEAQMRRLADRTARYRCFPSAEGNKPMDRSLLDMGLGALVVSQFTLCATTTKGLRPGFDKAAEPQLAKTLYEAFALELARLGVSRVETGSFQAHMEVSLVNDGPVTLRLEQR